MRPLTLIAIAMLTLVTGLAQAGEASLTWTNPTTNVDGSAIPASGTGALNGNRVEWGTCSGTAFGTFIGQQSWTAPRTAYVVTNLAPGTYCFRAFAKTQYGESGPSAVASKVIVPPLPSPPSGLTVADTQAFVVVKADGRFVMVPAGTVPAGTPCDTSQQVNGYFAVPADLVQWSGNVKDIVAVARCS